ncbi:hypothetical protein [Dethiobacter alkaliphilus]|uniref:hypothetical protein n=1 Tax=Dethiobacter alkaliphilus TaxID=427926 RepID=UPI002225DADA|nr:hypothetical protein [Dethiobacter alkaliphilus]MCW3491584.1 hypothetical protein [Dethiobacter alkaliphilus]
MNWERHEMLLADLEALLEKADSKKIQGDFLKKIINRLGELSDDCRECTRLLDELHEHIKAILEKNGQPEATEYKRHREIINRAIAHLQKEHNLVTEDYYLGLYMSLGIAFGLMFGTLILGNLAWGMPIGLLLGVVLGSAKDADTKKKGHTI